MMNKQSKTIIYIILFSLFLFLIFTHNISSFPPAEQIDEDNSPIVIERTANSDTFKNPNGGFSKRIYSGSVNMPDQQGNFKPYTEVTNFTMFEDRMIIEWYDKKVTLKFYDKKDNKKERFENKNITEKSERQLIHQKKANRGNYYYTHNMTKTRSNQPDVFGYDIITENTNCVIKGYKLICDEQVIDLTQAVEEQGLNVSLRNGFVEFSGNDLSYIDPEITYNFNATFQGIDLSAYGCSDSGADTSPPDDGPVPTCSGSSITDNSTNSEFDSSDDSKFSTITQNVNQWVLFVANLSRVINNANDVLLLNWTWEGSTNFNDKGLISGWLWNTTNSQWVYQFSYAISATDATFYPNASSSTNDYINNSLYSHFIVHMNTTGADSLMTTDFVQLEVTYEDLVINTPSNNDEVLNTLQDTLNISTSGYNNSVWYSFSDGKKNTTLCSGELNCRENQTTITFPRQGIFNLTVYANKSDGAEKSKVVSDIILGNETFYSFSGSTTANIYYNATDNDDGGASDGDGSSCVDEPPPGNSLPPSCVDPYVSQTNNSDLNTQDGTNRISHYIDQDDQLFVWLQANFSRDVLRLNWTTNGISDNEALGDVGWYLWNYTASTWDLCFDREAISSSHNNRSCSSRDQHYINSTRWTNLLINWDSEQAGQSNVLIDYIAMNATTADNNTIPTLTNLTANDTNFGSVNITISYNVTDDHEFTHNTTLFIWNSSGNSVLNLTTSNPILGINNSFYANLTLDGDYTYQINSTDSDLGVGTSGYFNFSIDTGIPTVNITNIATVQGSQTVKFNHTASDPDSALDSCKYNVRNSNNSIDVVNTTITCNANNTQFTVSAFGTYNLTVFALDTAGNENSSAQLFTTSDTANVSGGGGGGGTEIIIVQNLTWTMETDGGSDLYEFQMTAFSFRSRDIIFKNKGADPVSISLICDGDLCNFTTLETTNVTIPIGTANQTRVGVDIAIPREVEDKVYISNIIATDDLGNKQTITIRSAVGGLGYIGDFFDKMFSTRVVGGIPIPYAIIFLFIWGIIGGLIFFVSTTFELKFSGPLAFFLGGILATIPIIFL